METPLDPYRDWLGIEEKRRPLTLYQLLRLDPSEAQAEHIKQAVDQQIATVRKFLSGPHARLARRTLYELESAKQCLLDPTTKQGYDDALRTGAVAQPIANSASLGLPDDPHTPSPPLLRGPSPEAPVLDELSRSSLESLLDEAFPVLDKPASPAPNLAALGILPKSPSSARRDARKKVAIVILAIAIPVAAVMGLLCLAIRWFDEPSVANAPLQASAGANPATSAGQTVFESVAPRGASQSSSPQTPIAAPRQSEAPPIPFRPEGNPANPALPPVLPTWTEVNGA